jgi:hypothetical protein
MAVSRNGAESPRAAENIRNGKSHWPQEAQKGAKKKRLFATEVIFFVHFVVRKFRRQKAQKNSGQAANRSAFFPTFMRLFEANPIAVAAAFVRPEPNKGPRRTDLATIFRI